MGQAAKLEAKCFQCYEQCNTLSEFVHGQQRTPDGRGMVKEAVAPFPTGKMRIKYGQPDVYVPDADPIDPLDLFK